jgi:hypothetical protein
MSEEERKAIVESGAVYLSDGLRAGFAGIKTPDYCGIHSARPGFWACSWETAKDVSERPDRRFRRSDFIWKTRDGWLGFTPNAADYQTLDDHARAKAQGKAL